MEQDKRIQALEIKHALLEQQLEHNFLSDSEFKRTIIEELDSFKERNKKIMNYVESQLEKEKDKKEIRQAVKTKLATSGIWGVIILLCGIGWYAISNWVRNGGH